MIELGKIQLLVVQREKEFGVYLGEKKEDKNSVLLPKKQVPEGTKVGDSLEVFVYKDSQDRLIATTNRPKLQVGETAVLTVKDVAKIGAFLDMGLEKDLLLPFKEQSHPGRVVVAHKKHVSEILELTPQERAAYLEEIAKVSEAIHKIFKPAKVNYGAYGDTGHHLHFHLVPKYTDEYEWGGTFEMNPGKKFLSDEEYAEMIEKIKAELI